MALMMGWVTGKLSLGMTLQLMLKDIRLACQMGAEAEVPLLLGNLVREYYQMSISHLGPERNVQSVALLMDRLAGTQMVPTNHDA